MDAARWQRVATLFEAALQQAPEQRQAFLEAQSRGDLALLAEVSSLLAAHQLPDHPLTRPASASAPAGPRADGSAAAAAPAPQDATAETLLRPDGDLLAGQQFGPYRIERLLGAGGMGEVYLARDTRLPRQVALKLLGSWLDLDLRMVERFRKEAMAASTLQHPNIPTVLEAGVIDGRHFIASEYIDGEPLSHRLRRGVLEWRKAAAIAETLARALAAAHAAGIVHRDVKPGNILLDREDVPHLVDFGIAKLLPDPSGPARPLAPPDAGSSEHMTIAGAQIGTPGYMAPEQFFGETVGPAADQWSLAAVLNEMVTGKPPVAGTRSLRATRSLPFALAQVLDRALQAEPEARFAGMAAFAKALAAARSGHAGSRFGSRRRVLIAAAALGVATLLVLGLVLRPGAGTVDEVPSLGMLPFENLSPDPNENYFALGIEDELLTRLARVSGIRVLDRHAADRPTVRHDDLMALARQLRVDHLLEGSVQRQQGRVLVHVRLVDAHSLDQQWASRFESQAQDVFAIEREIAEAVTAQLRARLKPNEQAALAAYDTTSPPAHEAALKGRELYRKADQPSLQAAIALFESAVRLDPGYAQAYADLALARFNLDSYLQSGVQENRTQGRLAAERAVALAPELTDGLVALGWIRMYWIWDLPGALKAFSAAMAASPSSPRAVNGLAVLEMNLGDFARADGLFGRARRLDPLSGATVANHANLMIATGDWEAAERMAREALQLEPGLEDVHRALTYAALARGQFDAAETAARAEPEASEQAFLRALVRVVRARADDAADQAVRDFEQRFGEVSPVQVAALHARRGDRDGALHWLGQAVEQRDPLAMELLESPDFIPLRDDPDYLALCRRIGIPATPVSRVGPERSAFAPGVVPGASALL